MMKIMQFIEIPFKYELNCELMDDKKRHNARINRARRTAEFIQVDDERLAQSRSG
jgi:hypothetical protein